ncbi:MAG: hypothetical protein JNM12_10390 [Alphaproteobacteria bacterium]|nr:hypothetical protein [Alphaproteobacteria bacterium]
MSLPNRILVDLLSDLKSPEQVTAVFETDVGRKWLLTPMSKDVPDSGLSYMVDGYFSDIGHNRHKEFTTAALAALEKAEPDAAKRVALLTATNNLGQSVIHKSLQYGGHREAHEPILDILYKWAGEEKADAIMKSILSEPLGSFDAGISYDFQNVRSVLARDSKEYARVDALTTDMYHPVTAAALRETLAELRPAIATYIAEQQKKTDLSDYSKGQLAKMKDFYDSADPVVYRGTLLTEHFPGKAFFRLLEIQLKGDAATPQQKADGIFELLSATDAKGNTPMHRKWVASDLLSTPKDSRTFTDSLSPMLAAFDRLLGTDVAIDLAKKLLLQENEKGYLPLDIYQYPQMPTRDFQIEKLLQTLRKEMGSTEKFTTWVKEVIAPVLPADYKISLAVFEPKAEEKLADKPARGVKLEF